MNRLTLLALCSLTMMIFGCNSNPEKKSNQNIIGIWKSVENPEMGIEFDENGFYHLLHQNKRLIVENSKAISYFYNPMEESNFKLTELTTNINCEGKLSFLHENKIKIQLLSPKSMNLNGSFTRYSD